MDAPTFENLDLDCAKLGKTIAANPSKELEKLITSSLAVLEEQGIYALFLFLKAQTGKNEKIAKNITNNLERFLKEKPQQDHFFPNNTDIFPSLQQMAKDLDKLLLARDLVRQSLIYARYHARIIQETEERT